ncbi:MAG: hypothetical protein ACOYYS_11675 [Chloroflexota bacterium]
MIGARLRSYFVPSPAALTLAWAAGFELAALTSLLGVYGLTQATPRDSLLLLSTSGLPLAGVLLGIAALRERRNGPRLFLWAGVTFFLLASLGGFVISMASTTPETRTALLSLCLCCGPLALLPLGPMAWAALRAWPELKAILRAARYRRVSAMIEARGETGLDEIGREISLDPQGAYALLRDLVASGELMAFIFPENGRVYSLSALAEKHRVLLAIVQAQGKASLADLAGSLHVPPDIVRLWVYHLVQRGLFRGALDGGQGIVYSLDVAYFDGSDGRCPHCGGQLDLAGKGVIQCAHCGVEVFL